MFLNIRRKKNGIEVSNYAAGADRFVRDMGGWGVGGSVVTAGLCSRPGVVFAVGIPRARKDP